MIVEFNPAPEDLHALNAHLAARSVPGRVGPWPVTRLFAAIFGLAAATTAWPGGASRPVPMAAALGGLIAWACFRLVGRPVGEAALTLQSRLAWGRVQRAGLVGPQRAAIEAAGLRVTSAKGETMARWSGVGEVVRGPGAILVFVAPRVAFVVPRRAFEGDAAFDAFAEAAGARWRAAR